MPPRTREELHAMGLAPMPVFRYESDDWRGSCPKGHEVRFSMTPTDGDGARCPECGAGVYISLEEARAGAPRPEPRAPLDSPLAIDKRRMKELP